ncbi:MAG: hypothetical protein ACOCUF_01815 [Patescibacteria group bacterium]
MNDQQMPSGEAQKSQKKEWYQTGWGIVIAILFLPYFLVWYMWVKTNWNKKLKIAITIIFVIVNIAVLDSDSEPPQNDVATNQEKEQVGDTKTEEDSSDKKEDEKKSNYQWETKKDTLLRDAETVVVNQIGEKNNMDKKTVISIKTERNELWIKFRASENFTSGMTAGGIKTDMVNVFSNLNNQILDNFRRVTIVAELPLVDVKGNESSENVLTVSLKSEDIKEINWDNFLRENLEKVAAFYQEHPAIK